VARASSAPRAPLGAARARPGCRDLGNGRLGWLAAGRGPDRYRNSMRANR